MEISLVVPGRNAARTLRPCLEATVALRDTGELGEIVFVDDGSTDDSAEIAGSLSVRVVVSGGRGPGAARNAGWRAARGEAVWFIDADCVAEPDALSHLAALLDAPEVAGVGGSYANGVEGSLLADLIHEEIRQRHLATPDEVDYLGSFNVLYRRSALEAAGGFDETYLNGPGAPGAEDADLSYRLRDLGYRLRFEPASRVAHFHPTQLISYLKAQRLHGFWGARLYHRHPGRGRRNSYSSWVDHLQPPLALLTLAALPSLALRPARPAATFFALALLASHLPMARRLIRRTGEARYASYVPFGAVRSFARGLGLARGALGLLWPKIGPPRR